MRVLHSLTRSSNRQDIKQSTEAAKTLLCMSNDEHDTMILVKMSRQQQESTLRKKQEEELRGT